MVTMDQRVLLCSSSYCDYREPLAVGAFSYRSGLLTNQWQRDWNAAALRLFVSAARHTSIVFCASKTSSDESRPSRSNAGDEAVHLGLGKDDGLTSADPGIGH